MTKITVGKRQIGALSVAEAAELYGVPYWSEGFFEIGAEGFLEVHPRPRLDPGLAASLHQIVQRLVAEGRALPLILRFPQILESRLDQLNDVFEQAIDRHDYRSSYQGVFPIKVNQRRLVVESVAAYGSKFRLGLEAGSKAELALCLAQELHAEALLCCNGFKDDDFIRLALWGRRMGKNVVVTLEKPGELERVIRISREVGVRPSLGIRFKLHARGSGKWEESGGDVAKFGLNAAELFGAVEKLRSLQMLDTLEMLHAHVGSQITDIRKIKSAVREVARIYVELFRLGTRIRFLNVGGGLAVDYDGSRTTFYASANYGLREYADEVVSTIGEVCTPTRVPHPVIVTESGRALTAHHAVLILPVIDVIDPRRAPATLPSSERQPHRLIRELRDLLDNLTIKNYPETYYNALAHKDTMHNLFDLGYLSLLQRAQVETLVNKILGRVARLIEGLEYVPEDFEVLPKLLASKYVCNFSLFQSLPDHWAIQALFPVTPLSRLDEQPNVPATLVDISCDSDGKISKFVDLRDVKSTLPLHQLRPDEPYFLGIFLVGAYQDVLASAHNLFGRVNEVHVRIDRGGKITTRRFLKGQSAGQLIENMGYRPRSLQQRIKQLCNDAVADHLLNSEEAHELMRRYHQELVGYTYMEP